MKYIALSFDDGRLDTYEVAKPIMEKYGLTATVNVITDFVHNPEKYNFLTSKKAMTPSQICDWQRWGGEVACHGSEHNNTPEDILKNIEELKLIGVDINDIGFASPESWLTFLNMGISGIESMKDNGILKYLRSGIQVRREGLFYSFICVIEMITHSTELYYKLNKRCIFKFKEAPKLMLSAAIKDYTSVNQIKGIIKKMRDNDSLIIMLHSILDKDDNGYGKDHYYWDSSKFEELCFFLAKEKDIMVMNTSDLIM